MRRDLSLLHVRQTNVARSKAWHQEAEAWTVADWAMAMAGEAGEVCNAVKKLRRLQSGIKARKGPKTIAEAKREIAKEIADTLFYLDLLANHLKISLPKALVDKFNEISKREGFRHRLRYTHERKKRRTRR